MFLLPQLVLTYSGAPSDVSILFKACKPIQTTTWNARAFVCCDHPDYIDKQKQKINITRRILKSSTVLCIQEAHGNKQTIKNVLTPSFHPLYFFFPLLWEDGGWRCPARQQITFSCRCPVHPQDAGWWPCHCCHHQIQKRCHQRCQYSQRLTYHC